MASWKKILVEGDAVANNIATDDLTATGNRVFDLSTYSFNIDAGTPSGTDNQQGLSMQVGQSFEVTSPSFTLNGVSNASSGELRIAGPSAFGSYYSGFKRALTDTTNQIYQLPNVSVDGFTNGDCLVTDSSGNLSWDERVSSENPIVTGSLRIDNIADGTTGQARLRIEDYGGGEYISLDAPTSVSASYTITLPSSAPGGANKILESDANGDLSWITTPGGSIDGSGAASEVAYWSDADTLTSSSDFLFDGTDVRVTNSVVCSEIDANTVNVQVTGMSTDGDLGRGAELLNVSGSFSTTAGRMYYLNSSSSWTGADKDDEPAADGFLVVATGTNATDGMLIRGLIRVGAGAIGGTPAIGDKLYLSDGGVFTSDTSGFGTGDFVRAVGHYVATNVVYFNPSQEYIELA